MPVTENTPRQLVLKSGSTTLTLDKDAGKATLQRKLLIWRLKPIEAPLSDVSKVTVDTAVDRASGVEVCHTMLVRRTGEAWALPAEQLAGGVVRPVRHAGPHRLLSRRCDYWLHRAATDHAL
jgi:hypothetical protein